MKIGIDVGGVIVEKDGRGAGDTSFDPDAVHFVEGALEAISTLAQRGHELYVVSFCGANREAKTRVALRAAKLAVPEEHWHFTRSRQDKGPVCARLGLDAFVDDTEQVVRIVSGACPTCSVLWFRGNPNKSVAKNVVPVASWATILQWFKVQTRFERTQ